MLKTVAIIAIIVVVVIAGILLYAATNLPGRRTRKKDPAMKRTFGAVTAGKGATYGAIKLDFLKPFEAHSMGEFILVPKADTTNVTRAIYGPSPYMSKVMSTFMDFDKMIGRDFEQGLADLKTAAEK